MYTHAILTKMVTSAFATENMTLLFVLYEELSNPDALIELCTTYDYDLVAQYSKAVMEIEDTQEEEEIVEEDDYDYSFDYLSTSPVTCDEPIILPHVAQHNVRKSPAPKLYYEHDVPWVVPGFEVEGDVRSPFAINTSQYFYYEPLVMEKIVEKKTKATKKAPTAKRIPRTTSDRSKSRKQERIESRDKVLREKRFAMACTISMDARPSTSSDPSDVDLANTAQIMGAQELLTSIDPVAKPQLLVVDNMDHNVAEFSLRNSCTIVEHLGKYVVLPRMDERMIKIYAREVLTFTGKLHNQSDPGPSAYISDSIRAYEPERDDGPLSPSSPPPP